MLGWMLEDTGVLWLVRVVLLHWTSKSGSKQSTSHTETQTHPAVPEMMCVCVWKAQCCWGSLTQTRDTNIHESLWPDPHTGCGLLEKFYINNCISKTASRQKEIAIPLNLSETSPSHIKYKSTNDILQKEYTVYFRTINTFFAPWH